MAGLELSGKPQLLLAYLGKLVGVDDALVLLIVADQVGAADKVPVARRAIQVLVLGMVLILLVNPVELHHYYEGWSYGSGVVAQGLPSRERFLANLAMDVELPARALGFLRHMVIHGLLLWEGLLAMRALGRRGGRRFGHAVLPLVRHRVRHAD